MLSFRPIVAAALLAAGGALLAAPAVDAADPPFKALGGSWSGSGQLRVEGEKPENLKCKAYYTMKNGGSGLGMTIRCASAASKIDLKATLDSAGGNVTGTWEEANYNVGGNVAGKSTPGRISLAISGALTGSMSVAYSGATQTVTIATQGTSLKGVSISLSRG